MAKFMQHERKKVSEAQDALTGEGYRPLSRISRLPPEEQRMIYASLVPPALLTTFHIDPKTLRNQAGEDVFFCQRNVRASTVRIELRHQAGFPDPLFLLEMRETSFGDVEILFVNINNPLSERFGIDRDDCGNRTEFGTVCRNIPEEIRAMQAGLAPGQVRRGLRMYRKFLVQVDLFCRRFGITQIKAEAFGYHNAIMHEFYGFRYMTGRNMMEEIDREFAPGGILFQRLDGSTPFRQPGFDRSIKGRSWAIHDGILAAPWQCPRMYYTIGEPESKIHEEFTCHLLKRLCF